MTTVALQQLGLELVVGGLLRDHHPVSADELDDLTAELLWEIADLIVYQRDPRAYDASDDDTWVLPSFDELDLQDKVVIDSGAGTYSEGSELMRKYSKRIPDGV